MEGTDVIAKAVLSHAVPTIHLWRIEYASKKNILSIAYLHLSWPGAVTCRRQLKSAPGQHGARERVGLRQGLFSVLTHIPSLFFFSLTFLPCTQSSEACPPYLHPTRSDPPKSIKIDFKIIIFLFFSLMF